LRLRPGGSCCKEFQHLPNTKWLALDVSKKRTDGIRVAFLKITMAVQ
jgi:hypothetical protein